MPLFLLTGRKFLGNLLKLNNILFFKSYLSLPEDGLFL